MLSELIRPGLAAMATFAGLVTFASCTRQNPSAVFYRDGAAADQGLVGDGLIQPEEDGATLADAKPKTDLVKPEPDAFACPPNAALDCKNPTQLVRCNESGTGIVVIDCAPHACLPEARRCSQCNPSMPPKCEEDSVVTCSKDGLIVVTPCPGTCDEGTCVPCNKKTFFEDKDDDGFGDPQAKVQACEGSEGLVANDDDCDDADEDAHPGQTSYFTTPTDGKGHFDYNCNGGEQKEFFIPANCIYLPMVGCVGDGWEGDIPDCGESGSYIDCVNNPSPSPRQPNCKKVSSQKTQACR